jgi:hypothetical protein
MNFVMPIAPTVTLNLFQGPSCLNALSVPVEKWMLKQVQHDDEGGIR